MQMACGKQPKERSHGLRPAVAAPRPRRKSGARLAFGVAPNCSEAWAFAPRVSQSLDVGRYRKRLRPRAVPREGLAEGRGCLCPDGP